MKYRVWFIVYCSQLFIMLCSLLKYCVRCLLFVVMCWPYPQTFAAAHNATLGNVLAQWSLDTSILRCVVAHRGARPCRLRAHYGDYAGKTTKNKTLQFRSRKVVDGIRSFKLRVIRRGFVKLGRKGRVFNVWKKCACIQKQVCT
jgi:hypothetical protein